MRRGSRAPLVLALASLAIPLGACGGDEEETTETTAAANSAATSAKADGEASIDPSTGESGGLEPDERDGTDPPAPGSFALETAAAAAGCELELDLPDEGRSHVRRARKIEYGTAPPTSGDHDAVPLADGAYREEPDPRYFVHSLEHGRVVIAYRPSLDEEHQLELKGLFEEDPDGMVLIPYSKMPYEVAAISWTNLLGCDPYTPEALDAIAAFRNKLRGKGPEDIPL